jgi:putative tryptophan/tyrosine transport system substrate-binding protein
MLEDTTMTRRTLGLLVTLALGFLVAPLAPDAQPAAKIPRIGIIGDWPEDSPSWEVFRQGLRDLGYVEGQNLAIEWRFTEGKLDRLADTATELVRLQMDIIVTTGTPATRAAMHATPTIPIIMVSAGDPLRAGLVASLARPGGNVTGSTILGPELSAKRLQLLKEILPTASRVAFLWNPTNPANVLHFEDIQAGARALGVTLHSAEVRSPGEFESAFAAMMRERPDALIITADGIHQQHVGQILNFAAKNRLPVMSNVKDNVVGGALVCYGASQSELFRRAALYVDKILKGAKPGDLPVQQPMKFELIINLKTAQALGLTIPPTLLFQADEVIR